MGPLAHRKELVHARNGALRRGRRRTVLRGDIGVFSVNERGLCNDAGSFRVVRDYLRIRARGLRERCLRRQRHSRGRGQSRSEEHTSELQSLMRISYAVFCLKKKITNTKN